MKPPRFWTAEALGPATYALLPAGRVVRAIATRRARRSGLALPVPVFCCGNATLGGTGKTILALELLRRLAARGMTPHALTRGYRGSRTGGVRRVVPGLDGAAAVGDEAILLAAAAPTWVSARRAAAGCAAVAAGADAIVMDDGLQNFSLAKSCSFLLVDGPAGFGNGAVLPAGPLREDPRRAAARCHAVVLVGEDARDVLPRLAGVAPVLRARLVPEAAAIAALAGRPVVAFAGIGRPPKFFAMLEAAGLHLADAVAFPDHHPFTPAELAMLDRRAAGRAALLATTPKDAARLPPAFRARVVVVDVALAWADDRLDRIVDAVLAETA